MGNSSTKKENLTNASDLLYKKDVVIQLTIKVSLNILYLQNSQY